MKRLMVVAMATMTAGAAWACDDHHGGCEIEDWRWHGMAGVLMVEGVTTCDEGELSLRLYEGEGGRFLGVAHGYIEGHTFTALASDIQNPSAVTIKYSIEPE